MKLALLAFFTSFLIAKSAVANDGTLVAAASSLRQVWPLLMQAYSPTSQPRITFGSSGNLSRQILQGAPFELLLSADHLYAENLYREGKASSKPMPLTIGALAWVAPKHSPIALWLKSNNRADTFPLNTVSTLAIANPAFAPYGRAAVQVLDAQGIESQDTIKLTLGENAAQALQFALSGATDGGIVPLPLISDKIMKAQPHLVVSEVDSKAHEPLTHSMVLMTNSSSQAKLLFEFLLSEQAQTIFQNNGFRAID